MPSLAIKIDSRLAEAAREAAAVADRSLTAQIEHWARMGMELDSKLTGSAMMAFKRSAADASHVPGPADAAEIERVLAALRVPGAATAMAKNPDFLAERVSFGSDPSEPGGIIRYNADGSQTRGKMAGMVFVPLIEEPAPARHAAELAPRAIAS